MGFSWWYVVGGLLAVFVLFGKKRGGVVVKRYTAKLEVLDPQFEECRPEAEYKTFKEGSPDHIEIELENLTVPVGAQLELVLNGESFATIEVDRRREAEFDHWSDEEVHFPKIVEGDELVVRYEGAEVLRGTFR